VKVRDPEKEMGVEVIQVVVEEEEGSRMGTEENVEEVVRGMCIMIRKLLLREKLLINTMYLDL
jgi:hypothetical protein